MRPTRMRSPARLREPADGDSTGRSRIPSHDRPRVCSTSSRRRSGRLPTLGPTSSTRSSPKVILEAAQSYPSRGKSNIGGWRSRNDLFHWPVPEVKEIGGWIMDCVRQVVEATARPGAVSRDAECRGLGQRLPDGELQRPAHPPRVGMVGGVLRRCGRSRRRDPAQRLPRTTRPAGGRGGSQHPGRSLWTPGSNRAYRPACSSSSRAG